MLCIFLSYRPFTPASDSPLTATNIFFILSKIIFFGLDDRDFFLFKLGVPFRVVASHFLDLLPEALPPSLQTFFSAWFYDFGLGGNLLRLIFGSARPEHSFGGVLEGQVDAGPSVEAELPPGPAVVLGA
jgi:hypothetical protein